MMFSNVGSVADHANWFVSDELVVVGRVSMNAKNGKRNLNRIAKHNEQAAQPWQESKRQWQESKRQWQEPRQEKPKPRQEKPKPRQDRKPKPQKERQSRPVCQDMVAERRVECKSPAVRVVVRTSTTAVPLAALPADVLVHVLGLSGLGAVGELAATCLAAHDVWRGPSVWLGLAPGARCGSADAFRRHVFGFHGDWLGMLRGAEPSLEVLSRCVRLLGGFTAADGSATELVDLVGSVALACDSNASLSLVSVAAGKLCRKLFTTNLHEVQLTLRERVILERLTAAEEQDYDTMAFDYFAPIPEPGQGGFWEELENLAGFDKCEEAEEFVEPEPAALPEATSRALAAEFLEAMGIRHGHEWQTTAAAMTAIQQ